MAGRSRGRPPKSQTQKDADKASKMAAKDQAIADTAMAKVPGDREKRNELFVQEKRLRDEAKSISEKISDHAKRMTQVYGLTKPALAIRKILTKCSDGEYEATLKQVGLLLRDTGRAIQADLFAAQPGTGSVDDSPLFDNTGTGKRQAAEPGVTDRTPKKAKGEVPPAKDTGKLSEAEALEGFNKANEEAAKKRGGRTKKTAPPATPTNDAGTEATEVKGQPEGAPAEGEKKDDFEEDVRPRFMRDKDTTGEGPMGAGGPPPPPEEKARGAYRLHS